jgi:hypothetical protein
VAVHLLWFTHRVSSAPRHEKLSGPLVREACGAQLPSYDVNLEPLVRPVRLEQVHVEDEQGARLKALGTFEEGTGVQTWLPSPEAPLRGLVLRGLRWGCPSSFPVRVEPALSEDLGRTAYAWSTSLSGLAREKQEPPPTEVVDLLAASGDWVSPARSFLVVPPGAEPSSARTRAFPEGVEGGVVGGVVGGTILCPISSPRQQGNAARIREELTRLLQPVLSACSRQGGGASLQVRVETTGDELVDVEVRGATSETQAACVSEAAWALRLPPLCDDGGAGSYTVTLSPAGP